MIDMERHMDELKRELIDAIKTETHNAIKHTGHSWVKDAVKEIVPVAVEETLTRLGIDCKHPFECQADMLYLRSARRASEDRSKVFVHTIIRWVTPLGMAGVVSYLGIKFGVK